MRMRSYYHFHSLLPKEVGKITLSRIREQFVLITPMDANSDQLSTRTPEIFYIGGDFLTLYVVDNHRRRDFNAIGAISIIEESYFKSTDVFHHRQYGVTLMLVAICAQMIEKPSVKLIQRPYCAF